MKKYNIVFLFILLLFLGLSKNVNISTKDNSSTTSNVASDVSSDENNFSFMTNEYKMNKSDLNLNYEYRIESDGSYTLTKYIGTAKIVYVPSIIVDGTSEKKVLKLEGTFQLNNIATSVYVTYGITTFTTIANVGVFQDNKSIENIYISTSVTEIGDYTFCSAKQLKQVFIFGNVTTFNPFTFINLPMLKYIYYYGDGIKIWNPTSYDYGATPQVKIIFKNINIANESVMPTFSNFSTKYVKDTSRFINYSNEYKVVYDSTGTILKYFGNESSVTVPGEISAVNITSLDALSYSDNKSIINVVIEEGIKSLNSVDSSFGYSNLYGVFRFCTALEKILLPSTLTYIGARAFESTNLKIINQIDGINSLPNGITYIGQYAFANIKVESLTLGTGLKEVDIDAFSWETTLKEIIITSTLTKFSSNMFSSGNIPDKIIFSSKELYTLNSSLFTTFSTICTYKVEVQYQNVGLDNNPSFTTEFQDSINQYNPIEDEKGILTYTYYAGDNLLIPTLSNFNSIEGQQLKLYIDNKYSIEINSSNTTSDNQIKAGVLNKGTVNDELIIYCNLYTDPTTEDNQAKYEVASFDSNNNPVSNIFTINNLNNVVNLRFTNDANTGVTGLPVVGYTYTYTWYIKESNSSTFALISNNNDKEPSTLTLIPQSGKDLNCVYRCTIQIKDTSNTTSIIFSKDVTLTYEKEDITVVVNDQTASSTGAISSVYGTDYTASINGVVLSEDEMNLYFGSNYGLVSKSNNGNIEISFFGTLQEPYSSNYNVNTLQTGILTTKTNSTNLILISVTSGLFVVEVIVFMVVIFKQRSRG